MSFSENISVAWLMPPKQYWYIGWDFIYLALSFKLQKAIFWNEMQCSILFYWTFFCYYIKQRWTFISLCMLFYSKNDNSSDLLSVLVTTFDEALISTISRSLQKHVWPVWRPDDNWQKINAKKFPAALSQERFWLAEISFI